MKNPFRSLPARIVFFVFAATLITSLTVTGVSVNSIDSFLRDSINQKFPDLLEATAEKLDGWYDKRLREISVFSESEVLATNLPKLSAEIPAVRRERARTEIDQYISYVLDGFPQYAALFVLDRAHRPLLWVGEPISLSDALLDQLGSVDDAHMSDVVRRAQGAIQIASAPLRDAEDAPLGSLHAVLRLQALAEALPIGDLGPSGRIFLIDSAGKYVMGSGGDHDSEPFAGPLPAVGRAGQLQRYASDSGERVVGSTQPWSRYGWTLVVEQRYGEAFAPVVSALGRVLIINLAIVLVVGLAAFQIAVSIVRPIEALSDAAGRISGGARGVEIPETQSSDEVGVLTRAFNEMTMRLTNNAAELELSHGAVEEANERLRLQNEELQRVNEVLEQLSITDGLTKLHNHRYFHEVLVQECKRASRMGKPLALILVDIDYFKHWNDRLGHASGDEILRLMALVMSEMIRETDLLARYGGEEFALIAPNTDLEGATLLAEKMRATIASTCFVSEPPAEHNAVTVSIGVASYQGDRTALFRDADRALYDAKKSGRDCVVTADPAGA